VVRAIIGGVAPDAVRYTNGEAGATQLLILSQVVLSLQLPFAVYPLVRLTGSKEAMGKFANGPLTAAVAWAMTAGLIGLNGVLLIGMMT
jgi:manganese transport protein